MQVKGQTEPKTEEEEKEEDEEEVRPPMDLFKAIFASSSDEKSSSSSEEDSEETRWPHQHLNQSRAVLRHSTHPSQLRSLLLLTSAKVPGIFWKKRCSTKIFHWFKCHCQIIILIYWLFSLPLRFKASYSPEQAICWNNYSTEYSVLLTQCSW